VDDHKVVRQGLRALLGAESDINIVGEAESGREAVELACTLKPSVVVMDISMPHLNGLEATRQIIRQCRSARIIVLSSYSDDEYVQQLTEAGAVGYLVKDSSVNEVVKAVREAAKGNTFFSPSIAKRLLNHYRRSPGSTGNPVKRSMCLTSRENEVVQLVAEGLANKQIASELALSIKTVQKYRQQVMDKLNIHETAGLTRYAISRGIIESNLKEKVFQ
jgi:DNA-binding NarL/FixJ family response regulator